MVFLCPCGQWGRLKKSGNEISMGPQLESGNEKRKLPVGSYVDVKTSTEFGTQGNANSLISYKHNATGLRDVLYMQQ